MPVISLSNIIIAKSHEMTVTGLCFESCDLKAVEQNFEMPCASRCPVLDLNSEAWTIHIKTV